MMCCAVHVCAVRSLSTGPARVSLPAPLDRVPVLLQEGTVIPLHSPGVHRMSVVSQGTHRHAFHALSMHAK